MKKTQNPKYVMCVCCGEATRHEDSFICLYPIGKYVCFWCRYCDDLHDVTLDFKQEAYENKLDLK